MKCTLLMLLTCATCALLAQSESHYDTTKYYFPTRQQASEIELMLGVGDFESSFKDDDYVKEIDQWLDRHRYKGEVDFVVIPDAILRKIIPVTQQGYLVGPTVVIFRLKDGELVGIDTSIDTGTEEGSRMLFQGSQPYSATAPSNGFYFRDGELVYASSSYVNSTRMGSCGTISITKVYYFKDEALYKGEVLQGPFHCYDDKLNHEMMMELAEFWHDVYEIWKP